MAPRSYGRRAWAEHEARHLVVAQHYRLRVKSVSLRGGVQTGGYPNPMVELAFQLAGGVGDRCGVDFDERAIKACLDDEFPKKDHRRVRAAALRDATSIVRSNAVKIRRYADVLEEKGRL